MRLPLVALLIGIVASCLAQPFNDQDRFGKTYDQIASFKHAEWIGWYCDASRAGKGGRVTAEKMFAIALNERNQKLLSSRSDADRKFIDDCWIKFANLAKYAITIGDASYPSWGGWELVSALSSTSVNLTIGDLLVPQPRSGDVNLAQVKAEYEKGKKRIAALKGAENRMKYVGDHYPAMGQMIEQLAKETESRPPSQRSAIMRFCLEMVVVASTERKVQ